MAEELEEKKDKKEKKEKKAKKEKESKKKKDDSYEDEETESAGSKALLVFVTILIVAIWLSILGVIIKFDVGGFGSTVLSPILEDVPVLNMILPEKEEPDTEMDKYNFDSLDDAIKEIIRLEAEIEDLKASGNTDSETISKLREEIEGLSKYKEEQAAFEKTKEKFYEEVVFSDNAPDINEYKTYYESIDPENAQVLYKQVVEQIEEDEEIKAYAKRYSSMKPKEAAAIFDKMEDDLKLVSKILGAMSTQESADILAKMDKEIAAKVTKLMEP